MKTHITLILLIFQYLHTNAQKPSPSNAQSKKSTIENKPSLFDDPQVEFSPLAFSGGFKFTNHLFVDFNKKYPDGYLPNWKQEPSEKVFIAKKKQYFSSGPSEGSVDLKLKIEELNGSTGLHFSTPDCDCFAEILTKNQKLSLTTNESVLKLSNFKNYNVDKSEVVPCALSNVNGQWNGNLKVKVNDEGDLEMKLLQTFKVNNKAYLSQKLTCDDIVFQNNLKYKEAEALFQQKQLELQEVALNEKRKQEAFIAEKKFSQKLKNKISEISLLDEAKPKINVIYKGYKLRTVIDPVDLIPKKEFAKLETQRFETFVEEEISEQLKKKLKKAIDYNPKSPIYRHLSQFFIFAESNHLNDDWNVKMFEPHQVDFMFTKKYLLTNYLNKKIIEYAALVNLGEIDRMTQLVYTGLESDIYAIYAKDEIDAIVEYLKSKK